MSQYVLSIIIPHYDVPELLENLIQSIPVRQDIQILIVDDNSKDQERLRHVIASNSAHLIELYHNETGKNSAGTCRNIGLDHAKGKWILFADADDYYVDGWFEKLSLYFDSEYQMVYFSQTSRFIESGELANRHLAVKEIIDSYCEAPSHEHTLRLRYCIPASLAAMYQKDFLNQIHARFENCLTEEDKMFILTCGKNVDRFACISDPIYCVITRKNSLTDVKSFERFDWHQRMVIKRVAFLQTFLSVEEICELGMKNIGIQMLYTTIMEGYGIRQALNYRSIQRAANVPLTYNLDVSDMLWSLGRSLCTRGKKMLSRKKYG